MIMKSVLRSGFSLGIFLSLSVPSVLAADIEQPKHQAYAYLDMHEYAIKMLNAYEDNCLEKRCTAQDIKNLQTEIISPEHMAGFIFASFGRVQDAEMFKSFWGKANWDTLQTLLTEYATTAGRLANEKYPEAESRWAFVVEDRQRREAFLAKNTTTADAMSLTMLMDSYQQETGAFPKDLKAFKKHVAKNMGPDDQQLAQHVIMKKDFKLGMKNKLLYEPTLKEGKVAYYRIYQIDHEGFLVRSEKFNGSMGPHSYYPYIASNMQEPSIAWIYLTQQKDTILSRQILLEKCPKGCDVKEQSKIIPISSTMIGFPGEQAMNYDKRSLRIPLSRIPDTLKTLRAMRDEIQKHVQKVKKERFDSKQMIKDFIPEVYEPPVMPAPDTERPNDGAS